MGFPCNQFGNQEPGKETEIKTFATKKYGITFPLFAKAGDGTHRTCERELTRSREKVFLLDPFTKRIARVHMDVYTLSEGLSDMYHMYSYTSLKTCYVGRTPHTCSLTSSMMIRNLSGLLKPIGY